VFDPGLYTQPEKNFNVDASYPIAVSLLASNRNITSFEWRGNKISKIWTFINKVL